MRKTDKKTDNAIIRALTEVCEHAKDEHAGFEWLTHEADYRRFPQSLNVTLVFHQSVPEAEVRAVLPALVVAVQDALEPILGVRLPPAQIEARHEHSLH